MRRRTMKAKHKNLLLLLEMGYPYQNVPQQVRKILEGLDTLEEEMNTLRAENERLSAAVDEIRDDAERRMRFLREERDALRAENERLTKEVERWRDALDRRLVEALPSWGWSRQDVEMLAHEQAKVSAENERLRGKWEAAGQRRVVEHLEEENDALRDKLAKAEEILAAPLDPNWRKVPDALAAIREEKP
jgi:chromosome segregation ATPase